MESELENYPKELQKQNELLEAIRLMQNNYFKQGINYGWCEETLKSLLHLTDSKFGFICELLHKKDGTPYLKSHIITNIAWNDETRMFYEANKEKGLEFFNFESIWGQVFKTGKPYISDNPDTDQNRGGYPKESGHPHLKKFLGIPIKRNNNEVIGIMAVANNPNGYNHEVVTYLEPFVSSYGILMEQERIKRKEKEREQEILNNQTEVNAWLSNSPTCTKKVDLDFNLQFMSEAGIRELKVGDVNKFYGTPYPFYFFPKPFKKIMSSKLKEVKEKGEIIQFDGILSDMEGNNMWYDHILVPVKNNKEQLDYILVLSTDITSRKKAELKLKDKNEEYEAINEELRQSNEELFLAKEKAEESEEKFSTIFNMSQSLVCVADINTATFKFINPAFKKVLGYDEKELLSKSFLEFVHPDDVKATTDVIQKELKAGRPNIYFVNRYKCKDEQYRHLAWNSFPILKKGITYAIAHDITEQKKIEHDLIEAKEKAEESNRLKTAFLQNISHEIRTPLNAISGFSGILNKPGLSEEKRKSFVSIIQNSTKQLVSIVADILTISSIETKQEKLDIGKVCINNIIVDLLTIFKQQSINQNISLYAKKELTDNQSEIYTDKTKITQILSNLLTNALKYTHEGFVEFGYEVVETHSPVPKAFGSLASLQFYVKDSGIGIKPEFHEKIFERFRQADNSSNKLYGGTGLGLAICKSFAEIVGGKIWVQSELEKGSTFYFTIPYKPVNEIDKNTTPTKQNENFKTVLVAEDEEYNFLFIEELLIDLDLKIIHAKDGRETLEIFKTNPNIDLILMDIKMPIMTGHEAAKIIKELKPNLPIIAQSAYALEHERAKYEGVFDDYLTKPIEEDDLIEKVTKYIENK